ncbi:GDSL esterase/lipase [Gossypium australe]|uniref:GDSL esterase/lipase n=1 Tax=Gossypium australe TaxID=47621 RepID=A0A5B6VNU6_9ROSI|nr:GDSL esterase/lipase [Gossypium australe]
MTVELLSFEEFMPPFAKSEKNILQGVNYAPGASGILDETGSLMGARVPMSIQIRNHKTIIARIRKIIRNDSSTEKLLRQCIYSIQIGSNDFVNNYFKPNFYNSSHGYSLSEFATMLVRQFAHQIKDLYKIGARIFALFGLGQLGCTPNAIATHGTNGSLCPCSNRKQYAFWDGVHPTDASNVLIAKNLYGTRSFSDARPFNIQSLARKSSDDLI